MPDIIVPTSPRDMMATLRHNYCAALCWNVVYWPSRFTCQPANFHNQIFMDITEPPQGKIGVVIAGPREFAKTFCTLGSEQYDGINCHYTGQIHVGRDLTLAAEKIGYIIENIESNRILQADYNIRPGKKQTSDHYEIKVGLAHPTTVTFKARGFNGSIRGLHEGRIVLDDIESTKDSPLVMMDNYQELHGTVFGATAHSEDSKWSGQIVMIGNWLNEFCTLVRVQRIDCEDYPELWVSRRFVALEEGETEDFTRVPIGETTWPGFISTEALLAKRAMLNAGESFKFEIEYQNRLISARDSIWSREMFEGTYSELPPRHHMTYRVAIDSAERLKEAGDETAIVTFGKCLEGEQAGFYYFTDAKLGRLSPHDIATEALRQYVGNGTATIPQCDYVYLESKTARGESPLATIIRDRATTENINLNLEQVVPQNYGGDKRQRALKVVDIGRQGRILKPELPSPHQKRCIDQMCMFTGHEAKHLSAIDDGHDACVWDLIKLLEVKRRTHERVSFELADRVEAVAG